MHIFKRAKSTQPRPAADLPDDLPSSRQPLGPSTNIDLSDSYDNFHPKSAIARKISHRATDDVSKPRQSSSSRSREQQPSRGLEPPPRMSSRSVYSNHPDMYTQNDLSTFVFGAAASSSSPSPVSPTRDPLSRPRGEADSDDRLSIPDTTPRPSVISSEHSRSHQSLNHDHRARSAYRVPTYDRGPRTERDSDTASTHTFGTSSASASVSSLSRPPGSRSRSRGGHSSTTPLTSGNDLTSDDDDEDMAGRHPIPPELADVSPIHRPIHAREYSPYLSDDDDFDADPDDFDNDADEGSDHEFDSHAPSTAVPSAQRRGSAAISIRQPQTSTDRSYDSRDRDDNITTLRRPSRSLDELQSFSFAKASTSADSQTPAPAPIAPTSVPGSEGDWRDLRKRSIQRDKDLPMIVKSPVASTDGSRGPTSSTTEGLGFDVSWMHEFGANGLVGFDPDEMAGIVGQPNISGRRPSGASFRKGSTASTAFRRQSTVSSTNIDIMHKRIVVWGAQRYADSQQRWLFVQEQDRLESPTDRSSNLSIARERPSLSSMFSRPSTSSDGPTANLAVIAPFREPSHSREKATGKDKDKKEASKEAWKGMQLNSEEIWCNGWSGRFRVNRKNTAPEAGKGPQQRLNISYIRHPHVHNATNRDPADGPCVTVHKHSKAGAFSISRHYPSKSRRRQHSSQTDSGHSGSRSHTPAEESDAAKKKGSTILLAPRRVQKSYTSTNTTRKLEAHGLLDDNHGAESDRRRKDRDGKGKERMGEPSRHKEKAKSDKKPSGSRKNSVIKATSSFTSSFASTSSRSRDIPVPKRSPDSSEGSSAGSAPDINTLGTSSTTTAVTTPEHSEATSSFGSVNSIEASIYSKETDISDRTISQSRYQRRRSLMDDVDDDSEDERRRRPPSRTPYRETYAALPPEAFENVQQESTGHRLFGWGKSRNNDRNGVRSNPYVELSYNPPWPVATPRVNSETRRGIVDDLNTSFQDVGLLPAIGEIKSSANHAVQKRKRGDTTNATVSRTSKHEAEEIPPKLDILCDIPDDCLYMVLPLWPGETDPGSAKKYPCVPQEIPVEDRTYLLVCYRVPPAPVPRDDHINSKNKQVDKKRSRTSPTSSYESTKREDRSVLLKTFHISARVVVYSNLQGTDIRIPDIGLAVSGPLQDAFDTMPHVLYDGDIVIGICHARSRGVEFVPEGFEKLGLTRSIPNPRSSETLNEEDDVSSMDTLSVPTPMGRAVMEMAWLGGIAVTSFNTTS